MRTPSPATLSLVVAMLLCLDGCSRHQTTCTEFVHGLRYDPMQWVDTDTSLTAAKVRLHVFGRATARDSALFEREVAEILADQKPLGGFEGTDDHGRFQWKTAERLMRLYDLGVDTNRPEVRMAISHMLTEEVQDDGTIPVWAAEYLCLVGKGDHPLVAPALERAARRVPSEVLGQLCPWGEEAYLTALGRGAAYADIDSILDLGLRYVIGHVGPLGSYTYKCPWGFVALCGKVDHPLTRRLLGKLVPVILRAQHADGGWGKNSLAVHRALRTHNLLDSLRALPRLPNDWVLARETFIPAGTYRTLAWDGANLWSYDTDTKAAVAISPEDGAQVRRIALPWEHVAGIAWWDSQLVVIRARAKEAHFVDTATGQSTRSFELHGLHWVSGAARVNNELWVGDPWHGCFFRFDPSTGEGTGTTMLPGPNPIDLAGGPDARELWYVDHWTPGIVQSDTGGEALLDWGGEPFGTKVDGVAWDGARLWALDSEGRRVCVVRKRPGADMGREWYMSRLSVDIGPILVSEPSFGSGTATLRFANRTALPATCALAFAVTPGLTVSPSGASVALRPGEHKAVHASVTAVRPSSPSSFTPVAVGWSSRVKPTAEHSYCAEMASAIRILPLRRCREKAITVDGILDEWDELPVEVRHPELVLKEAASWTGADDCRFRIGTGHTDGDLVVAVQVIDDEVVAEKQFEWTQDGIEVFVDARPRDRQGKQPFLQIAINPGDRSGTAWAWMPQRLPRGTLVAASRNDSGYTAEVVLSKSYLRDQAGGDWERVRVNVAVNDRDADGQACLWWKPDWRGQRTYAGSGMFARQ